MKIKTTLSKGLVLAILATAMILPAAAFADEVGTQDQEQTFASSFEKSERGGRQEKGERPEKGEREGIQNPFRTEEKEKLDIKEKVMELATEYSPSTVSTWTALFESRETVREEINTLRDEVKELSQEKREAYKEEQTAERDAFINDLKAKVESGELTDDEAAAIFDEKAEEYKTQKDAERDERELEREARKADREADREEHKAEKEAKKAIVDQIKAAIENEDYSNMGTLLDSLLEMEQSFGDKGAEEIQHLNEKLAELNNL